MANLFDADSTDWPCGACHLRGCPGDAQGNGCPQLPPDPFPGLSPTMGLAAGASLDWLDAHAQRCASGQLGCRGECGGQ